LGNLEENFPKIGILIFSVPGLNLEEERWDPGIETILKYYTYTIYSQQHGGYSLRLLLQLERGKAPTRMWRDDLATLYSVTEESVMENLEQRFAQGNIYTYLGDILLLINPFHSYPIYGPEVRVRGHCYRNSQIL
jgi:hypothetical protein